MVHQFQKLFLKILTNAIYVEAGSFDGMYDIYNYREDSPTTDNGTPLKYFPFLHLYREQTELGY